MSNELLTLGTSSQMIVDRMNLDGILSDLDAEKKADPKKIVNWLRQLLDVTIKKDQEVTCSFIANLSLMLYAKFPKWAFSSNTLQYIAENSKFFPTYNEFCTLIPQAIDVVRQKQARAKNNIQYAKDQNFNDLSATAKGWVNIFYNKTFRGWKEENEEKKPSLEIVETRENENKKLMLRCCPEAYQFLFPKEWKEQLMTPERILAEKKGSWVSDAGVLNTIQTIETIENPSYKKQTIFHFKNAIAAYAPEWNELVEEQYPGSYAEKKEEKKQGYFA